MNGRQPDLSRAWNSSDWGWSVGDDRADSVPTYGEGMLGRLDGAPPASLEIDGTTIAKGSRVRLHPHAGGDILDLALDGKIAFVEAIEQDFADKIYVSVTVEDDPGRDLGDARQPGHRFFFSPDELEPTSVDQESQ